MKRFILITVICMNAVYCKKKDSFVPCPLGSNCSSCDDDKTQCLYPLFTYTDSKGRNLLDNSSTLYHYNQENFYILFENTNTHSYEKYEYSNAYLSVIGQKLLIRRGAVDGPFLGNRTFLLALNSTDYDTIQFEMFCKGTVVNTLGNLTQVTYNGKPIYQLGNSKLNNCSQFTIVKRDDELQ